MKKPLVLLLFLLAGSSCAVQVAPPASPAPAGAVPETAWAAVLKGFVDDRGRIDFAGLSRSPSDLESYVAHLARLSPDSSPASFPTPEIRLAFLINSYNALAIYGVLKSGIPADLEPLRTLLFSRNRFELGGRLLSLEALERDLLRPDRDPRLHMAINAMARSSPRLPREPFRAEFLDAELQAVSQYFFAEPRNVELLPQQRTARFNGLLRLREADFLRRARSLIAYANLYREEKIPEGWRVEFLPFDWRLNAR